MFKRIKSNWKKGHKERFKIALSVFALLALISSLIYFGPRILGFAILQQPAATITLKIGTYDRTTSWNSTGLVSWWKFDEGTGNMTADSAGSNNGNLSNGTAAHCGTDGACPSWTDVSYSGKALKFDGLGDWVNVGDKASLDMGTNNFSISVWIKGANVYTSVIVNILSKGTNNADGGYDLGVTSSSFYARIEQPGQTVVQTYTPVSPFLTGTWHHIVVVYNRSDKVYIYLDGTEVSYTSQPSISGVGNIDTAYAFVIASDFNGDPYFNGTIDEIKIWNRSLSSEEIWHEYQGRSGIYTNWTTRTEPYACDSNTVALWHFDDSSSDNCQNNGGTITMTGTHDNFTQGKFGKAFSLDGAGDYVNTTLTSNLSNDGDFTAEVWVKIISSLTNRYVISQSHTLSPYASDWFIGDAGTGELFWMRSITLGTSSTVADNSWHHVAMVWDNSKATYEGFIDGVSVGISGTVSGYGGVGSVKIGSRGDGTDVFFNGSIDEVRISNKSRTPEEFREFYRQGTYRKQWDSTTSGTEWKTLAWNVSRASKFGQELTKDDSAVLLMHFNNDSAVGESYNTSNGTIINDYSDGNNNGTLYTGANNGITYSSTGGKLSGAFTFDGLNDRVGIPESADFKFAGRDFTIEWWMRWALEPTTAPVLMAFTDGAPGNEWYIQKMGSGSHAFRFTCYVGGYCGQFHMTNPPAWNLNQWYHISFERRGSSAYWFVDGTSVGATLGYAWTNIPNIAGTLYIGGYYNSGNAFNGTIDEFAIYNRSLREDEIADHFERGEEVRKVWLQTRSSTNNITWTGWTGNKEIPQPNEQITNASGQENGTLLQLSFDDASTKTQTIGQRGYKGYDNELPYSQGNDQYTKLLLHMDGANGSQTFTDSEAAPKTVTANGQAYTDTRQSKFGGSSGFFDGTDDFISSVDSSDWDFGSGDFTIDFRYRFNTLQNSMFLSQYKNDVANRAFAIMYTHSTTKLRFAYTTDGSTEIDVGSTGITWAPVINTWYHLAFVRNGGNFYFFINGVLTGDVQSISGTIYDSTEDLRFGVRKELDNSYVYDSDGWLDELRISKGIARWTSSFDVPSMAYDNKHLATSYIASPAKFLSAFNISKYNQLKYPTGASVDDSTVLLCRFDNSYACDTGQNGTMSVDGYTKLLLHMDGSNGSTTFADSETTPKTVTANGQAYTDTRQSKFGGASGFFDGTGDYLSSADHADWSFGTGDFTIDFWVRFNTLQNTAFLSQYGDASNRWYLQYWNTDSRLYIVFRSEGVYIGRYYYSWTPSTNTWYHLAFVRDGSTALIFVDGVSQTLTEQDAFGSGDVGDLVSSLYVNQNGNNDEYLNGWLDELRISKGIARWTSGFAPPAYPYGQVITSTSQKKFGTASGLFDGTGDYLTLADSDDWDFGTGAFTIDFWVRFNALPAVGAHQVFTSQYTAASGEWQFRVSNQGGDYLLWLVNDNVGTSIEISSNIISLSANTWYHIALVRNGNTFTFYQDGISVGSGTDTDTMADVGADLTIGTGSGGYRFFNGWLDEVRISKGIARWTSGFAVPTSEYNL